MATKNAINSSFPIEPAAGGTSASTLTDHGVLVGAGTSAVNGITVGSTGELISGDTGSAPSFGVNASGDFNFTSSTAGGTRILKVENTNNSNSASSAVLSVSSGGSSAGDASIGHIVDSVTTFSQGVDNSDSDNFVISANAALGTSNIFSATTAGEVIKPLTSAFGAVAADQANVTGSGTVYTVTFTSSEYFDQNGDFDGTSTFTAPITGKYVFNATITYAGIDSNKPHVQTRLVTTARLYNPGISSASAQRDANDRFCGRYSFIVDMDAADTATVAAYIWSTGSDDVDILGSGTFFNGYLAC